MLNAIMEMSKTTLLKAQHEMRKKRASSCTVDSIVSPDEMLCNELGKVIEAGDKLAEAAHYVQSSYDGIHRLRLALAGWYKTRANENGRANAR